MKIGSWRSNVRKMEWLVRFCRMIFPNMVIAILVASCLGGQGVKGIDSSSASAPQQETSLPGDCVVDGGNIQNYLNDTRCETITVKGSNDPENPREYFQRDSYNLTRSGVTLQADGYVLTGAIVVSGSNNIVRGFIISDSNSNAGIRTYGNNNLIEYNEIYHMKQDGIWFFGSYNIFRGNYIHDILDPSISGDPHVDCFQTWSWNWDVVGNIIEGNICNHNRTSGSNQLIMLEHSTKQLKDLTIRNNVWIAHDIGYVPIALYGDDQVTGLRVINNTFYNTTNEGESAVYAVGMTDIYVANNASIGYQQIVKLISGTVKQENNVASGNYGMEDFENYRVDRKVNGVLQVYGFHLLPNSPLIDAGVVSLGSEYDFDGKPRVGKPDVGAFEYP
jgi:Right handed beta helix region